MTVELNPEDRAELARVQAYTASTGQKQVDDVVAGIVDRHIRVDREARELLEDDDGAPLPDAVQAMRRFFLFRETDVTEVTVPAGGEPRAVATGVVFADGQCALWWNPPPARPRRSPHATTDGPRTSVAIWPSIEDLRYVHLHPRSKTELVWVD